MAAYRQPYHLKPNSGPDCSTKRSAALRKKRLAMFYEKRSEPETYANIARIAADTLKRHESRSPAMARAKAMEYVVSTAPVELDDCSLFVGGENPFFYNLLLPALNEDRYARIYPSLFTEHESRCFNAMLYTSPGFAGHITPGCDQILLQGTDGIRARINERLGIMREKSLLADNSAAAWYEAALLSINNVDIYAERLRAACDARYSETGDGEYQLRADILENVPKRPAHTFREALQSYWIVHALITMEMGGCVPGGGIGFGRPDQYLYPFYLHDIKVGILTRAQALEYMELFLLNFTHNDYYTHHQMYTPGTQGSLCGITPTGADAFNELSELIMEASARIHMPAPYISIRLNKRMSEDALKSAANYVTCGLGFPVVNDGVMIPAFLRHGRSLADANDYICSCCYENTIPGRESFNPSASWFNSALVLELVLNDGRTLLEGEDICDMRMADYESFDELLEAYFTLFKKVMAENISACNRADKAMQGNRAFPLMSVFIDDCISSGLDVVDGGARYDLTGIIVAGIPNLLNSLTAIRETVYERKECDLKTLVKALRANFNGYDKLRHKLLQAPKWGNGDDKTSALAKRVTDAMYDTVKAAENARGGRFQLALYSWIMNRGIGWNMGASPDGRKATQPLTRNLNPAWGTDKNGPTSVLRSLSGIDFTQFPNGSALDLRFDPSAFATQEGRDLFGGFLMGMVDMGVMQVQVTFTDTETLLDAREHPERYPELMVKVAGYSARFVDLDEGEKDEIIGRSLQRLSETHHC